MTVGMPAHLYLEEFGAQVELAFGEMPYHVGSSLKTKSEWRDVDVRLILSNREYKKLGLGNPDFPHENGKWVSLCMAYSALGKSMTGLPIDFQIQQQSRANKTYKSKDGHARQALGWTPLRMKDIKRG